MRPEQEEIFTQLYHQYFNQIKLYLMSLISDPHLAEEITQDTFHTAMMKIDDLIAAEPAIAWLKRTAKYKALNAQRKQLHHLKYFLSLEDLSLPPVSAERSVEDTVIRSEEERHQETTVNGAFDQLSPEERVLFRRVILDQEPYARVSEELGITVWTCQKRVQRLRAKLQKKFRQYDD